MADSQLTLPNRQAFNRLLGSPEARTRSAVGVLVDIYNGIDDGNIVEVTAYDVHRLCIAAAEAIATHERLRGGSHEANAHLLEVARHERRALPITSKPRLKLLVPEPDWEAVAFEAHRRITVSSHSPGIQLRVPGLHRHFLIALDGLLKKPKVVSLIEAVEAKDTASKNRGKNLPGAIVAIGLLERLIAAQQTALISRLFPLTIKPSTRNSLVSDRIQYLDSASKSLTWKEFFWGFHHEANGRTVPGLKETQFSLQQYAGVFNAAVTKHYGSTTQWNGNFAAFAWRTSLDAFDRALTMGDVSPVVDVMSALAMRDIDPFVSLIGRPSEYFSDSRRNLLRETWNHQREINDLTRKRQLRQRAKQAAERRGSYDDIETSAEFSRILDLQGSLFWDPEVGAIVRIGDRSEISVYTLTSDEDTKLTIPGITLTWFSVAEDGLSATIASRPPRTDSSGRESARAATLVKRFDDGLLVHIGHTETESIRLQFDKPFFERIADASKSPVKVRAEGKSPPIDIETWALERNNELYRCTDNSYLLINTFRTSTRVNVETRAFTTEVRSSGELDAVRQHHRTSGGHIRRPRQSMTPLDLWCNIGLRQITIVGQVEQPRSEIWRIRVGVEQLSVAEVIRGNTIYPIALDTRSTARAWTQSRVGNVYLSGNQAFLVGTLQERSGAPDVLFRPFDVVKTGEGYELFAHRTGGTEDAPNFGAGKITTSELWKRVHQPDVALVGKVTFGPPAALFPKRIKISCEQMSGVANDKVSPPMLEVPEYLDVRRTTELATNRSQRDSSTSDLFEDGVVQ